ncbi:MAG: hypothetical protein AAFQ88_03395 [Pseudomonadota bacterium]
MGSIMLRAALLAAALAAAGCQSGRNYAYDRTDTEAEATIRHEGVAYAVLTDYDRTVGGYMNWVRGLDGALTEADRAKAVAVVTDKVGPFLCQGEPFAVKPDPENTRFQPPSVFFQPERNRWIVIADCA